MNKETDLPKLAFSVEDAARVLGVGRTKIFSEISEGRMLSFKSGGRTLISLNALHKWIADREAESK